MDPVTIGTMILGGGSLLAGLFSRKRYREDPRISQMIDQLMNPGSKYYQEASKGFYNRLADVSPTTNTLLSLAAATGASYGGSQAIASEKSKAIQSRIGEEASSFSSNLYGRGMESVSGLLSLLQRGQMYGADEQNAFANQLMGLGGGLLAQGAFDGFSKPSGRGFNLTSSSGFNTGGKKYNPFTGRWF